MTMTSLRRVWTDEDQRRAEELSAAGWVYRAIGKELGFSHETIRHRLAPAAVERGKAARGRRRQSDREARQALHPSPKARRVWSDKDQKAGEELRAEGQSYLAIGRALGWHAETVRINLDPTAAAKHKESGRRWHQENPERLKSSGAALRQKDRESKAQLFPAGRPPWSEDDQKEAEQLQAEGWGDAAIARKLGVSRSTVSYHLDPAEAARVRESSARRQRENPELSRAYCASHRRRHPERVKESNDKWRRANPERVAENRRAWRRKNAEKLRQDQRRRHAEDPERHRNYVRSRAALKRAAHRQSFIPLTLAQKNERFALFGNACAYCGRADTLTVDHVLALTNGGHDEAPNVVPACRSCNSSKNASFVQQWYRRQPFFDETRWRKIQRHCPNASRGQLMMGWQL